MSHCNPWDSPLHLNHVGWSHVLLLIYSNVMSGCWLYTSVKKERLWWVQFPWFYNFSFTVKTCDQIQRNNLSSKLNINRKTDKWNINTIATDSQWCNHSLFFHWTDNDTLEVSLEIKSRDRSRIINHEGKCQTTHLAHTQMSDTHKYAERQRNIQSVWLNSSLKGLQMLQWFLCGRKRKYSLGKTL